jgi:sentrin-specific protease 8
VNLPQRKKSIFILLGQTWLSDRIISFFFSYLEQMLNDDRYLFISAEVTQCIKSVTSTEARMFLDPLNASSKQFIFMAVNDNNNLARAGGSHWSLLVYSKSENTFFHYDSSGHSNWASASELKTIVKQVLHCSTAEFVNGESLQQNNSYDCGVHLLCTCEEIIRTLKRSGRVGDTNMVSYGQVKTKRAELLNLIIDLGGRVN